MSDEPRISMRRGWLTAAMVLSGLAVVGCGGSSSTTPANLGAGSPSETTPTAQSTPNSAGQSTPASSATTGQTTTQAAQPAAAPTCDQFCLQAAPEGGPNNDGCVGPDGKPYSVTSVVGCLNCPSGGCLDIVSTTATAANGIVPVQLRCRLDVTCEGALVIMSPSLLQQSNGSPLPYSKWVGGSDFSLPANASGSVNIGLTQLGRQLVGSANGYQSWVFVQLKMYGEVQTRVALLIH